MIKFEIPDASDIGVVADWIELNVLYEGEPISKEGVSSIIRGNIGSEPPDEFISSVWNELDNRMLLYGDYPPFVATEQEVQPNIDWKKNPEYLMLLILSLTGNPSNPTPTGKLFERISKEATQNYIGGKAIIFGHPSKHKIVDICTLTNEKFKSELPSNYNDRGVDVLGWKPFNDNRGNQVLILMQCAGGLNWTSKTGNVVMRAWTEKYITFGCTPVKAFSTAVVVSNKERFEEVSFETDLLFDRPRIYSNTVNFDFEDDLRKDISEWCTNRLSEIFE